MRRLVYCGDFPACGMSESYACKAWKLLIDTGKHLTDFSTLYKQDALLVEKDVVIAAEPVVAAVSTVDNDAWLDANEDDD